MTIQAEIFRLLAKTQSYEWGKLGTDSKVAQYAKQSNVTIDPTKPYAELWMGTHPNAPSSLNDEQHTPLKQLINDHPDLSTNAIYDLYDGDLPFLLKILSIRKALSIQAHPDKTLGKQLHAAHPDIYKDPNHKPEMAIALTPFEALCGFRPLQEIEAHLHTYPELAALAGSSAVDNFFATVRDTGYSDIPDDVSRNKLALRSLFAAIMNSIPEDITRLLRQLTDRLRAIAEEDRTVIDKLILRLDAEYPGGDVGVFSSLLLNYVTLEPNQAMFLGANEPHAYLSGDIVECMATSDNVVRAGLTPKFKDVKVLVDMLTYRYGSAESQKMTPKKFGSHTLLYDPPIDEFAVLMTHLDGQATETQEPIAGPSILIVTQGNGSLTVENVERGSTYTLKEGYVYFVGANVPISTTASESGLVYFRAFTVLPSQ